MSKLRLILALALASAGAIAVAAPAAATTLPAGQVVVVDAHHAAGLITAAVAQGETVASSVDPNTGKVRLVRMVQTAQTWGCAAGTACIYTAYFGTGSKLTINVGTYGTSICWAVNGGGGVGDNTTSSATVDYGSGLDLRLWDNWNCTLSTLTIETGFWVNMQGSYAWFDNRTSSFKIGDWI